MLRILQWVGAAIGLAMLGLLVAMIVANPYRATNLTLPIALAMALALAATALAFLRRPLGVAAVTVVLFVPFGLYLLGTPGIFRLIGGLDVILLILALVTLARRPHSAPSRPDAHRD